MSVKEAKNTLSKSYISGIIVAMVVIAGAYLISDTMLKKYPSPSAQHEQNENIETESHASPYKHSTH